MKLSQVGANLMPTMQSRCNPAVALCPGSRHLLWAEGRKEGEGSSGWLWWQHGLKEDTTPPAPGMGLPKDHTNPGGDGGAGLPP